MNNPPPINWPDEDPKKDLRSRLFSRGTKLSEVPPDFHGLTPAEWEQYKMQMITEQCSERAQSAPEPQSLKWIDAEYPVIKRAGFGKGRVANARDGYGL